MRDPRVVVEDLREGWSYDDGLAGRPTGVALERALAAD